MIRRKLDGACVAWTGRGEGDLAGGRPPASTPRLQERRRAIVDRPWSWLLQVHGDRVVVVEQAGGASGEEGDALVTAHPGAALAVFTADCAPVALAGGGVVAAVHAGWRGLVAGVVDRAVEVMRHLGARDVVAALGPCIRSECYEFSVPDLDAVAAGLGDDVRSRTAGGAPALDVPAAVRAALARAGVPLVHDEGVCTACSPVFFSHRARGEPERQAMVVWKD